MLNTSGGETWLGTNRGLFKLATSGEPSNLGGGGSDSWAEVARLEGRPIYALAESDGAVWAGAGGGLFVKPKGASDFSRVPSAADAKAAGADEAGAAEEATTGPGADRAAARPLRSPEPSSEKETAKEVVSAIAGFRGQIYAAFYDSGVERIQSGAGGFTRAPAC